MLFAQCQHGTIVFFSSVERQAKKNVTLAGQNIYSWQEVSQKMLKVVFMTMRNHYFSPVTTGWFHSSLPLTAVCSLSTAAQGWGCYCQTVPWLRKSNITEGSRGTEAARNCSCTHLLCITCVLLTLPVHTMFASYFQAWLQWIQLLAGVFSWNKALQHRSAWTGLERFYSSWQITYGFSKAGIKRSTLR